MEQSSFEGNSHSASKEVPHHVWNPKVHYHVYKSLLCYSVLSQMNLVHIPTPCFF